LGTVSVLAFVVTVLGSAAAGSVITAATQAMADRRAGRRADRDRARDLLTQVVTAAAALETERAVFRERRYSWRASFTAAGQAALEMAAAARDGNWLRGAAVGVAGVREWDASEGARFTERFQASGALISPALVQLSLMSPVIGEAAARVGEALAAGSHAGRQAEVKAASQALTDGVASLRDAVLEFAAPPRRTWRRRQGALPKSSTSGVANTPVS
jgi:hypothetical protein